MANPVNHGVATGRLAADPVVFTNQDGSRKVNITVYAANNFKSRDGQRKSVAIPLEDFVPANTPREVYGLVHKGDLVSVTYAVRVDSFLPKGETEPTYETKLVVESIQLLESRTTTQARLAQRGQAQGQQTPAAQPQAPQQAPAPQNPVQQWNQGTQAPTQQPQGWTQENPFGG